MAGHACSRTRRLFPLWAPAGGGAYEAELVTGAVALYFCSALIPLSHGPPELQVLTNRQHLCSCGVPSNGFLRLSSFEGNWDCFPRSGLLLEHNSHLGFNLEYFRTGEESITCQTSGTSFCLGLLLAFCQPLLNKSKWTIHETESDYHQHCFGAELTQSGS
jgi:hypothetical protein